MTVTAELTRFAAALRRVGIAADSSRVVASVSALAELDPTNLDDVYWATRLTLCAEPDDLVGFDAEFEHFFRREGRSVARPVTTIRVEAAPHESEVPDPRGADRASSRGDDALRDLASTTEILLTRDIATLDPDDLADVQRMISLLAPRLPTRRTPRRRPGGHQRVNLPRTVRMMLRDGGELGPIVFRQRRPKPRRLVVLIDVSGSMAPYADALLRFAHAAVRVAPASTEAYTMGTRLTRITRQLRARDPLTALAAAGSAVPDWSGGTRLGESLKAFLDLWGQRGIARQAVVVFASDGWERGDAGVLGEQMARLGRLAQRIVWVNPHKGKAGFAPLTAGLRAAEAHIDTLVAGHSLQAFANLARILGSESRSR